MTSAGDAGAPLVKRWAPRDPAREEVLRLIGGSDVGPAERTTRIGSSLTAELERQGLSINPVMSVSRNGRHVAAAVGLGSPGGSALVLLGPTDPPIAESIALLREFLRYAWSGETALIQALLLPEDRRTASIYRDAGFEYLAELIYCESDVVQPKPECLNMLDISYITYSPDSADQFAEALSASYVGSLDCPGLAGTRDTRDVLLGHQHTGRHDPDLWFLAKRGAQPVGIILLTNVLDRSSLEVVYMGVAASERGRGIGGALLSMAIDVARQRGKSKLTLAVDSTNTYARRVYERWGFGEVARRRAWIARRPV